MTTHESTVTSSLGGGPSTPVGDVPALTEVRDEYVATIPVRDGSGAACDGDSSGLWVRRLRLVSAAALCRFGLGALRDDAQVLVSELVTNALRYGRGEIRFHLLIAAQGFLLVVQDGSGCPPRMRVVDLDSESGRGLLIVDALADRWGVTPDGTTTWCTLSRPGVR